MKYTIKFLDLPLDAVKLGGGKAVSLAHMLQSGVPVPPGFVVTTEAFSDFNGKKITTSFEHELLKQFDELNTELVAVRSSAIAEDSSDASWAGQLESYLNVSRDNLVDRIRKCWKSIESEQVRSYISDKKLTSDDMRVAVAVQKMVQSESAGVMFTVDPITKDVNRMLIDGVYGLGEMIVQGIVTPDSYEVSRQPFGVIDYSIQIKTKQMVYSQGANRIINVPESLADKAVLREKEVEELARIGLGIEKLYGLPQDIEWAREEGMFYIVQARPITTL
jgi:phosphoenolpyruvate synthase/pyruvate phosphate dikinase